jgi:D-alanyl-lipoteichoic acid acyltransferase DltB (MBOAT superfamily)
MDSASIQFVMFGLAAAVVSNLSRSPVWRSAVLLIASLVFLALLAPHPLALVPLLGFLALGYAGLVLIHSGRRSSLTSLSVLAVVLAYVWLKKYTFLPDAVFLRFPYFTVGLSYIFFRVLHLLIEAGDVGPAAYLIYTLNFTSFAAGPIQRYDEFARDQFAAGPAS